MKEIPSLDMLDRVIVTDAAREVPLHAQVRRALKDAIENHFDDGQQFWTETALIERLGLSQITVRRALQDLSRDGFLERRRAKGSFVRKAKSGLTQSVGIFVPAYDSAHIATGLELWARLLRPSQRRMNIYHTHQGETVADAYALVQGQPETESIILFGTSPQGTAELHRSFHDRGFRVVTVDCWAKDLPGPHIGVNNALGIELNLRHLVDLGHERILLLNSEPEDVESVVERRAAFARLSKSWGLDTREISSGFRFWDGPQFTVEEQMTEFWKGPWHPTAIMTISDEGAWAVMSWAWRNGIRIPDELSVVGFDDDRPSRNMQPALTTTAQPLDDIARRALEVLDAGGEGGYEQLPPTLIVRESTAAPATTKIKTRVLAA